MSAAIPYLLFSVFGAALVAPALTRIGRDKAGWLLALVPGGLFVWFARHLPEVAAGRPLSVAWDWVPQLGVSLSFHLDGLSLLMVLLVTGIGALVLIYAGGYLRGHHQLGRFFSFFLLFMGAMIGLVLANDIIALFVFWELTSISSYLLIGFNHESEESRKKALQALLVTGLGGMALLAGLILLGAAAGTTQLSLMAAQSEQILAHDLYLPILLLVLLGAFTKSAQVPFHFWLPNAMAAPTPVSAYLHSATMVKAGVYLLARLSPVLGGTAWWSGSLAIAGGLTMLVGALLGLYQTDLKRILAYSTLSVLGILVMLIGLGNELALQAAIIFLLGHALYKACLFMVAGSIDHASGTRDVRLLRGLRHAMPLTATAAALAAFSKAGFPPFFGFLGKEYVYKSGLYSDQFAITILAVAVLTNMLLLALALKSGVHPFWGKAVGPLPHKPHDPPFSMLLGPLLLAGVGLALGLAPNLLEKPVVGPALEAMVRHDVELKLAIWHGFNLPLVLSTLTVAGGLALYAQRNRHWLAADRVLALGKFGAERAYYAVFEGALTLARQITNWLQTGSLSNYVRMTLAVAVSLLAYKLFVLGGLPDRFPVSGLRLYEVALMILMAVSALMAALTNSRLTALLSLGVVGFGVALMFLFYSAPDLAITQILVETLTVVLFLFVVYRLPRFSSFSSKASRVRDAIFASVVGMVVTAMVLKAQHLQFAPSIADQYGQWSYSLAKGKNVVNVILVDFRSLDTFGEIVVLGIAALGVLALLGWNRKREKG